ncbi:MAG: hypothetical protein ACRD2A_17740 [Vicinamibacterales bacterium]
MTLTFGTLLHIAGQIVKTLVIAFLLFGALSILGVFEVRPAY